MNKLTTEKCKTLIERLSEDKRASRISIFGELYLQALEIALPVLEQQDGWVSCSDRMPRHRQSVLGWQEKPGTVIECYSEGIKWYYDYSDGPCGNITHWQPLPAPPQQEMITDNAPLITDKPDFITDTYRQIENDGWVEWKGGDCPVDDCTLVVVVKFRDGETGTRHAGGYRWAHYGKYNDIIAYRVIGNG